LGDILLWPKIKNKKKEEEERERERERESTSKRLWKLTEAVRSSLAIMTHELRMTERDSVTPAYEERMSQCKRVYG